MEIVQFIAEFLGSMFTSEIFWGANLLILAWGVMAILHSRLFFLPAYRRAIAEKGKLTPKDLMWLGVWNAASAMMFGMILILLTASRALLA